MKKQSWTPDWPGSAASRSPRAQAACKRVVLRRSLLLHAIFNSENFSLIATDRDGVIQIFNVGAERMLGYTAADVVNRSTPADLSLPTELLARAVTLTLEFGLAIAPGFEALVYKARKGLEDIYELTYVRRNGTCVPAVVSVTALRDPHHSVIGYLLIGTDNSARQAAEEVLTRHAIDSTVSLQRFRTAMDTTVDAIMLISRSSMRLVEVNATACAMLGYTRAQFFAMHPAQLCHTLDDKARDLELEFDSLIASAPAISVRPALMRCRDGNMLEVELHLSAQYSASEWIVIGTLTDVTERTETARSLYQLAYYDTVTTLPNRRFFNEKLVTSVSNARNSGSSVVIIFLDLDHFKNVNDTLGHAAGDELLAQFSRRIKRCVRVDDIVCRLGGDEFAMILLLPDGEYGGAAVATKIRSMLKTPFVLKAREISITASIGITVYPTDATDPETLLRYADTAMYQAKEAGRDGFRFFTPKMNEQVSARLELDRDMRRAFDEDEFVLHYQPKRAAHSGALTGVEALLRWSRPGRGLLLPFEFMSSLERTGLIITVGCWVIDAACAQLRAWQGTAMAAIPIAVNISGKQFSDRDLFADVTLSLARHEVPGSLLELELTESTLMENTELAISRLQGLRALGVRISIDDFGTGYSSLAYLSRFPVDCLKIDISFVRAMTSDNGDASIVRAIIGMAHSLKLKVVAEGVETSAQLASLQVEQCDQVQGWLTGLPVPAGALELVWAVTDAAVA